MILTRKSMLTKTHSIGIEESILREGYKLIIQDLNNKYGTVEVDLDDKELDTLSTLIEDVIVLRNSLKTFRNTPEYKTMKSIENAAQTWFKLSPRITVIKDCNVIMEDEITLDRTYLPIGGKLYVDGHVIRLHAKKQLDNGYCTYIFSPISTPHSDIIHYGMCVTNYIIEQQYYHEELEYFWIDKIVSKYPQWGKAEQIIELLGKTNSKNLNMGTLLRTCDLQAPLLKIIDIENMTNDKKLITCTLNTGAPNAWIPAEYFTELTVINCKD